MSYNNSRALGRSQGRGFSGRGGGGRNGGCRDAHRPSLSNNDSFKETGNRQGGKSKLNPGSMITETSVTSATAAPKSAQNGHAQPTSHGPSTDPAPPKEQMRQSSPVVLDSAQPGTPIKEGTRTVALQFGTISPGVINELKFPARTCSAPPNLDEQKQDQAYQPALRAAPIQPIPPGTLQKQQQQTLTRNDPRTKNKPSSQVHPEITTAPPVVMPSVVLPPNSSNVPIQGVSLPMGFQQPPFPIQFGNPAPQQIPIMNVPHPHPLFLHNLPPHPMQHPVMHHNFQMVSESTPFGVSSVPTSQFLPQPLPFNFVSSPHRNSPVKITNPKTHEELRLDPKTDNNSSSSANTSHTQIQPHQQPVSSNSNGVTVNVGQNGQVVQVGQSRQPISFMGPMGSTGGWMKSNGFQADHKLVVPTATSTVPPTTVTEESMLRDSEAPIASFIKPVRRIEQAIESTFAAITKDDKHLSENQLTTPTDLPSGTGVKNAEAFGSTGPSTSVTEFNKIKLKDSDSISNIPVNVDGRNNGSNRPKLEKADVPKSADDSRVHSMPMISEYSQNAKQPVLSKQEERQMESSEDKVNSTGTRTISNHDVHSTTSGTKGSNVLQSTKVNPRTEKKKKRRDLLLKADAARDTDLYNAYKRHEEKPKVNDTLENTTVLPIVNNGKEHTNDSKNIVAIIEEKETKDEDENWEDADVTVNVSDNILKIEAKDIKKYTRDFLLTFSERCTNLPLSLVIGSDIAKYLLSPNPSRSSAGGHGDHRGNKMFADGKWNKSASPLPMRDIRNDPNHGASRYPRGQSVNQYYPSPNNLMPQMVSPHGTLMQNNFDHDRWRSLNNSRGLMPPPPPTPLQVMHKAENKYVVGKISDEEQAKQRQLKGILNKLTPQNFEKLFQQVKDVNIDNTATLAGVIAQIFDKALMEPTFCEMYADFCYHLSDALPYFMENGEKITFKRLLLNKCQEEFERGEREQAEANKEEEEGEVKPTVEEREEKRSKARRRMLGNIRLVGEIYKKRMLTERIIHDCIRKLLGEYDNPDEENLESLCKLLTTVGDQIDNAKAREFVNSYFDMIVKLSNNKKLSSRLRFMLRDVIDLRDNRWQQRRKVEGPKKIEDVHRDAAQEKISQTNRLNRGSSMSFNQRRGSVGDYNSRTSSLLPSPSSQPSHIRGYTNQAYGHVAQDARLYEHHPFENRALSFPSTQRPVDDNVPALGPCGLARGMSFRQSPPNGNTSTSNGNNNRSRKDFAWGSVPNREQNFQGQNAAVGVLESRATVRNGQSQGPTAGKPLSEEVLKKRSMATIREFYSIKDEKEVALCIRELNSPSFYPSIVSLWVTDSFERKDEERELLAQLLVNLCKAYDHVLGQIQLIQGFESVLSMLEDTVTDAPRAAEYLGRIFVKIILENVIPLREIGRIIHEGGEEPGHLLEIGLASEVLGYILEIIKEEKGDPAFKEIITNSGLKLDDFRPPHPMKSNKLDAFL